MPDISTLAAAGTLLDKIAVSLAKIQGLTAGITASTPRALNAVTNSVGPGMTSVAGATGGTGAAAGNGMPAASFGGYSALAGAGGIGGYAAAGYAAASGAPVRPPLLGGSKIGVSAVALGAVMMGVAPEPTAVMNNAATFYGVGLGARGYNSEAFQNSFRESVGGLRDAADYGAIAGTLNSFGIGANQSLMAQAGRDAGTLSRAFNWDGASSAAMVGMMSSGQFAGQAYRFGIRTSDDKGNPLSMDQQFENIYQRLYAGKTPTGEGIQNNFRAGWLGQDLSTLGLSGEQQQVFVKWATQKADGGKATVESLGGSAGNKNPLASAFGLGKKEMEKMTDAQSAVILGYEAAAKAIGAVNDLYMEMPAILRDFANATKSATSALQGNSTSNSVMDVAQSAVMLGAGAWGIGKARGLLGLGGGAAGRTATGAVGRHAATAAAPAAGRVAGLVGRVSSAAGVVGRVAGSAGRWGLGTLGALATFGAQKDTVDMYTDESVARFEQFRKDNDGKIDPSLLELRPEFEGGSGSGFGGPAAFSAGNITGPPDGVFNQLTALTTFTATTKASSGPTSLMGWLAAQNAGQSNPATGTGAPGSGDSGDPADKSSPAPSGSSSAPNKGGTSPKDLAGWFEGHIGDTYNPLTKATFYRNCLKNVSFAVRATGGQFARGLNTAAEAAGKVKAKGAMHSGTNAPRNALFWWGRGTGGGAGHVAVSDGRGNAVNNWGGSAVERHPVNTMAPNHYMGWSYANALASYGQGAWSVSKNQTANIHAGEMILPAGLAESVRTTIREGLAGGRGGKNVTVNLKITNATDAEALQFAHRVKALMEDDGMLTRMARD